MSSLLLLHFSFIEQNTTCRFKSHPHLIRAHGAGFVHVKLPEYSLTIPWKQKKKTEIEKKPAVKHWLHVKITTRLKENLGIIQLVSCIVCKCSAVAGYVLA